MRTPSDASNKTEKDWRSLLSAEEYAVLRERHTEPAGSGEYDRVFPERGHFACRACGAPLYSAASKFDSGCGWPAFSRCYLNALRCEPDLESFHSCGARVEIVCAACASHMGHVFIEGNRRETVRHCVNSLSIRHVPADAAVNEEHSLREEHNACNSRALDILMGGGTAS